MIFRITERIVQQPSAFVNLEIFGARVYGSSVDGDQRIGPPLFGRPQHDGRIAGRARRGALQVSKLFGYDDLVEAFALRIELIEPFGSRQPQFTLAVSREQIVRVRAAVGQRKRFAKRQGGNSLLQLVSISIKRRVSCCP